MSVNRRQFLQGMAAVGVAGLTASSSVRQAHGQSPGNPDKPNIVMILPDDIGWNDVGYHGSEIQTPNVDALAEGGATFEQHYVTPTCSPTRVGVLTGRQPAHFNVFGPLGSTTDVQPEDMRLPFGLQDLGYKTHIVGKWHIGDEPEYRPLNYGFETSYGYLRGQIDPYTHRYKFGDYLTWHRNDEFIEERGHVTDLITEEAVRLIEDAGDEPFFLVLCHHAPHFPCNEPPSWIEPYEDVFDDVWRQHFAAAVTHMDDGIGKVIDALDRTGKRENTLVIFSSDNGGQESWGAPETEYNGRYAAHTTLGDNTPLRGWKGQVYEGGIRVPAFVNWPGKIPGGSVIEPPTQMTDWAPTLIRLGGGEPDPDWQLEGVDLWPLITGEETSVETRQLFWNHGNRLWALREGDWKLIDHGSDQFELFNIAEDPYEERDLAGERPDEEDRLKAALDEWRDRTQG
ncbi:MAG: sulfatase-like hydrolase/transferase [Candidatus Hydrogenedentota bacterium]